MQMQREQNNGSVSKLQALLSALFVPDLATRPMHNKMHLLDCALAQHPRCAQVKTLPRRRRAQCAAAPAGARFSSVAGRWSLRLLYNLRRKNIPVRPLCRDVVARPISRTRRALAAFEKPCVREFFFSARVCELIFGRTSMCLQLSQRNYFS